MKIKLLFALTILLSFSAFGQGKVNFSNGSDRPFVFNSTYLYPADLAYAGQPIPTTVLPSGSTLYTSLYAGTSASSLTLQTSLPLTGSDMSGPGLMSPHGMLLSNVPGGVSQFFQVFVWSGGNGFAPGTIASADDFRFSANSFYYGTSGLFTFTPGASVTYPVLYASNSTWASGEVVIFGAPEPSSFTLVVLAAFLRWQIGRREQK